MHMGETIGGHRSDRKICEYCLEEYFIIKGLRRVQEKGTISPPMANMDKTPSTPT